MKVKYANRAGEARKMGLTPTSDEMSSSIGDKIETSGLSNTLFNLGESNMGQVAKGGTKALGAISSVAGPVMEGSQKHQANREIGKQIAKTGSVDVSEDAKDRLEETFDQMQDLVKEADGGINWKKPLAWGALGTLGAAGMKGGVKGIGNLVRSRKAENTWEELQEEHPELANEDTREHFEVVKQFAPDLATNPSTARSFLKRMKRTGMAPHEFVDRLTQTQGNIEKHRMSGEIADEASSAFQSNMPGASDIQRAEQSERHFQDKQSSGLQQELDELDPR